MRLHYYFTHNVERNLMSYNCTHTSWPLIVIVKYVSDQLGECTDIQRFKAVHCL